MCAVKVKHINRLFVSFLYEYLKSDINISLIFTVEYFLLMITEQSLSNYNNDNNETILKFQEQKKITTKVAKSYMSL